MTGISIQTNAPEVAKALQLFERDQFPFVTSLALNLLGNEVQKAQRTHQYKIFDVTQKTFAERSVKIRREDRSTKQNHSVTIRYETPGQKRREDLFTKFEDDTEKRPFKADFLWAPVEAPRKQRDWRPKHLGLERQEASPRSRVGRGRRRNRQAVIYHGKRKTFAIIYRDGRQSFIFERDYDELVLLYASVESVPIEPELDFEDNARRVVVQEAAAQFGRAWDRALGIRR
ncbi:hypothetical protein [Gaopeijia maritima]|uniref:hypothetical protein n=1 Tax=Gaopeijia maritima TaxID=3119007 RepID=UPI003278EF8B